MASQDFQVHQIRAGEYLILLGPSRKFYDYFEVSTQLEHTILHNLPTRPIKIYLDFLFLADRANSATAAQDWVEYLRELFTLKKLYFCKNLDGNHHDWKESDGREQNEESMVGQLRRQIKQEWKLQERQDSVFPRTLPPSIELGPNLSCLGRHIKQFVLEKNDFTTSVRDSTLCLTAADGSVSLEIPLDSPSIRGIPQEDMGSNVFERFLQAHLDSWWLFWDVQGGSSVWSDKDEGTVLLSEAAAADVRRLSV